MRTPKAVKSLVDKELEKPEKEQSIIGLGDWIVEFAFVSRTSDIHLEPDDKGLMVRIRVDGILHDAFMISAAIQPEIISRIKVLSGLKTDIHQVPQDGRFKAKIEDENNKEVDVRVSIAPTYYGENCVMRILAEASQVFSLEDLGFTKDQMDAVNEAIKKPLGMILATAPTGSGKTTTLYTMIKKISSREVSVIPIEDPIEYSLSGITQMPVNVQAGLTFAAGLRSILR